MIERIKQRWLMSLLCSFILPFNIFLYGTLDIFAGNREEFAFGVLDFLPIMLLFFAVASVGLFVILTVLPKKAYPAGLGLLIGTSLMCILQSLFLNFGIGSLSSELTVNEIGIPMLITDTVLWVLVLSGCIFAAYKTEKFESVRIGATILLIAMVGMSLVGIGMDALSLASGDKEESDGFVGINYLNTIGMTEVAPDKNIIVFLIDRFDVKYYNSIVEDNPQFFEPLTGFTYFSDNISGYTATYPSVCHIITGEQQDFTESANDYFNRAYNESAFFKDLKDNGYSIKVYTGSYYAYRDGTSMTEYIENARVTDHYVIKDKTALINQMSVLTAFRCAPSAVKLMFPASWFNFKSVIDVEEEAESVYSLDDVEFAKRIFGGISVQTEGTDNSYIFYHLNGCHYPVAMDANCQPSEEASVADAATGCFKIIYSYIEQLKALGLYEKSTIVITGDHSSGFNGGDDDPPVNGTALFVKPAGKNGEKLAESCAQVCDENLISSLIGIMGINTQHDYGKGYFDIAPEENTARTLVRFKGEDDTTKCIHFEVKGPWRDKNSWKSTYETEYEDFYR